MIVATDLCCIFGAFAHVRKIIKSHPPLLDGCAWLCYGSGKESLGDMQTEWIRENVVDFTRYVFSLVSRECMEEQGHAGKHADRCGDPEKD